MSRRKDRLPIWARLQREPRRRRLSSEQIAATALRIADAEGFEAVSMRRIAKELRSGTMSLYHYIQGKDDLVALMDDALLGEALLGPGELAPDWRAAVAQIARRSRAVFLRHPWAVVAVQGAGAARDAPIAPNSLRHFEQSLAALDTAPLTTRQKLDLLAAVDAYVFGNVLQTGEIRMRGDSFDPADAERAKEFAMEQVRSGHFPHLEALAQDAAAAGVMNGGELDMRFERGLQMLIDGAISKTSS